MISHLLYYKKKEYHGNFHNFMEKISSLDIIRIKY